MLQEQATTRAQSHDWVVSVPMPVRLQIGEDGSVTAVVPAGMPALDQVGQPTCRRCGATSIELTCEQAVYARRNARALAIYGESYVDPGTPAPVMARHKFLPDFDHRCVVCSATEDHPVHDGSED